MSDTPETDAFFARIGKLITQGGCALLIFPLISLPLAVYGVVFYLPLWHWFVVPLGAPDISLWHAVGLRWLWGVLQTDYLFRAEVLKPPREIVWAHILRPPFTLAMGAVIHFWLGG